MKRINCRGLACPEPVVQAKRELEKLTSGEKLVVSVDNPAARENVLLFAQNQGCETKVISERKNLFTIEIKKNPKESKKGGKRNTTGEKVICISSNVIGRGSDKLGAVLMGSMLGALPEIKPLPKTIIFMNTGVKLTVKNSPTIEKLRKLEQAGINILICGTCLDYFKLKDKTGVGAISNMFTILETFLNTESVISF
ncbi:MAG: sulfurtransferase-like selenium metabolism protein YedF [Planctomycetota bacterium]